MSRGRKKKKPDYDAEKIMQLLIDTLSEAYSGQEKNDSDSGASLQKIAEEFEMSRVKVRKLLITAGVYSTDISEQVNELRQQGKTVMQIMEITGLGRASVYSYIPYSRTAYNTAELSLDAEKCRKYRERKLAVEKLKKMMDADAEDVGEQLWNTMVLFENYTFHTVQGLKFRYTVQGQQIFVNREQKSITKSSVDRAYEKVMELRVAGQPICGPKQLGVFGASYIFVIFLRFRIVDISEFLPV
jgi:hypothetical protein